MTTGAEERLQRLIKTQGILSRVAREIGPALELQPVLKTVLSSMRELFEFKGGTICLVENGLIRIAASDPDVSPEVAALRLPVGSGIAGRAVRTGRTVYSPDLDVDPRVDQKVRRLGSNATMKSYLAVPLICLGEVIGLVQVDSARAHAFDGDEVVMFEGLAAQVAGAIESARRYEKVVELEALKNDFLARVSHELRTPLTAIVGFGATLQGRWESLDGPTRNELFVRMQRATERLRALIEELLEVSSVTPGGPAPRQTEVKLAEVFDRIAIEQGSSVVTASCAPDLVVTTDERILRDVLGLTVENALAYAGDAEIGVVNETPLVIDVRDHGPGIPADMRDLVFERFVRGSDARPGMGLGLSLVRTLASAIGSRVDVVDPPSGPGACLRFTFDRAATHGEVARA